MEDILKDLINLNKSYNLWSKNDRVILAVSTGPDSMALLNLFINLPNKFKPQLNVLHINHKIRQQSEEEEKYLTQFTAERNIPLYIKRWNTSQHPKNSSIEAAAHDFRYRCYSELMNDIGAKLVITAHQADEQAETILMNLIRGFSINEKIKMPFKVNFNDGYIIHPLLNFKKQLLLDYLKKRNIKYYTDKTNYDLNNLRNRVRNKIIPLLVQENPNFVSDIVNRFNDLENVFSSFNNDLDKEVLRINHSLSKLKASVYPIKELLKKEFSLLDTRTIVEDKAWENAQKCLMNSIKSQFVIDLNSEYLIECVYDNYQFLKRKKIQKEIIDKNKIVEVYPNNELIYFDDFRIKMSSSFATTRILPKYRSIHLCISKNEWPLKIRYANLTDKLLLYGGKHKSVKRILIDQKVPEKDRDKQLILTNAQDEPLWLIGRRVTQRRNNGKIIELTIMENSNE